MKKPVLIVMAAGMGSRYGGLKQIDKISAEGEIILDFSLYDAKKAGFEEVIFVIRKENEHDFRELIDECAGKHLNVEYVFQSIEDIPEGYKVPDGREKPWGTCHAVMSAAKIVDGPFAVINADDYYGAQAFKEMYSFLEKAEDNEFYSYGMIGYKLENTLTENGHVARGICTVNQEGYLDDIVERTKIMRKEQGICYTEDDGENWHILDKETIVSMNFWGFTKSMMDEMVERFPAFLDVTLIQNPLKGEYFLPGVVDDLLKENKAKVKVLISSDKWQGVTYKEDKEGVVEALKKLKESGAYPQRLWE